MKIRRNITINPEIAALAEALMKLRKFDDFSGFVEQLIREEYERRTGPVQLTSTRAIVDTAASIAEQAVVEVATKRRGRAKVPRA